MEPTVTLHKYHTKQTRHYRSILMLLNERKMFTQQLSQDCIDHDKPNITSGKYLKFGIIFSRINSFFVLIPHEINQTLQ